jgi:hypothetical protein
MKRKRQNGEINWLEIGYPVLKNLCYPAKKPVLKREPTWLVRTFDGPSLEGGVRGLKRKRVTTG